MEKRKKVKEVRIRMEDDLYGMLKSRAKASKRSINRQAEVYLEDGIKRDLNEDAATNSSKLGESTAPRRRRA